MELKPKKDGLLDMMVTPDGERLWNGYVGFNAQWFTIRDEAVTRLIHHFENKSRSYRKAHAGQVHALKMVEAYTAELGRSPDLDQDTQVDRAVRLFWNTEQSRDDVGLLDEAGGRVLAGLSAEEMAEYLKRTDIDNPEARHGHQVAQEVS